MSKILYETAQAYTKAGQVNLAQDLFTAAAGNPNATDNLEDKLYMALSYLALNQTTQAEAVMEDIYSRFAYDQRYGETVLELGLAYYTYAVQYDPDRSQETTESLQTKAYQWISRYIQDCPFHEDWTPMARLKQAQLSLRLEQYSRARTEFETWLDAYDGHELTPYVSLYLGSCYKRMVQMNLITFEEFDILSHRLYQDIVKNFPESDQARISKLYIDRNKEIVQ